MADRFGISESSFKLYVKGILGESYLTYFRKKRMEKAAEFLESTNLKVIEVANSVGYENQGLNNGRTYEKSIWTCRKYLRVDNRRDEDTGCVWCVGNQLLQGKQKSSCSKRKANWIIRKKLRNYKMHSKCSKYNTHEHQQNLKYYEDKIWLINQVKVIYWMHKKRNRVELQFCLHTVF